MDHALTTFVSDYEPSFATNDSISESAVVRSPWGTASRPAIRIRSTTNPGRFDSATAHSPSRRQLPAWMLNALEIGRELSTISGNWDGAGALALDLWAFAHATVFLSLYMDDGKRLPAFIPTRHGSIQLEWHRNGADLEIQIDRLGKADVYFEAGNEMFEGPLTFSDDRLAKFVNRVIA